MIASVSSVSYGAAAAMFALLSVLLLTAWRGRLLGGLLLAACLATVVWAAALAVYAYSGAVPLAAATLLEMARGLGWLLFLWGILARANATRAVTVSFATIVAGGIVVSGATYWGLGGGRFPLEQLQTLSFLVIAILGLVFIEQTFRGTRREDRWQIKLLCIGVGGQFTYDFFLYAHTLLFNQMNPELWAARGVVQALVVPFIALTAVRNPEWSVQIFVSRHVVFGSVAVLGCGIYLLAMAGTGYYFRSLGGSWGRTVEIAFLFGALALLAVLLTSQQLRSQVKVFVAKHFFRNKYDYRETWLDFTQALSGSQSDAELREDIVRSICGFIESPGGAMWTMDRNRGFRVSASWGNLGEVPVTVAGDLPLMRFLHETEWVVYVDDCRRDPVEYDGLVLPDWMPAAGVDVVVPLLHQRELLGFLGLVRSVSGRRFDWEDTDLLKTVGRQAAGYLALLRLTEALGDAKQFDAFNRLSSYVVHDLKNLVAQLDLVVSNSQRHLDNPAFVKDAIDTVSNASSRMRRLLEQLRKGRLEETGTRLVNVGRVLAKAVKERSAGAPRPVVERLDDGLVVRADAERLVNILGHIIQNAQDATPASGEVRVSAYHAPGGVCIEIRDTGTGMDPEFIAERLFRPFETTKGNAGMGIGVYETREFVKLWGGDVEVESKPGVGTCFRIRLPTEDTVGAVEPPKLEVVH